MNRLLFAALALSAAEAQAFVYSPFLPYGEPEAPWLRVVVDNQSRHALDAFAHDGLPSWKIVDRQFWIRRASPLFDLKTSPPNSKASYITTHDISAFAASPSLALTVYAADGGQQGFRYDDGPIVYLSVHVAIPEPTAMGLAIVGLGFLVVRRPKGGRSWRA